MLVHAGPAKTFNNDQEAWKAIVGGRIQEGDVIVVRYEGVKGAPGMKEVMLSTDALCGAGLEGSVGLITDGAARRPTGCHEKVELSKRLLLAFRKSNETA